jgi:hypothetical protein
MKYLVIGLLYLVLSSCTSVQAPKKDDVKEFEDEKALQSCEQFDSLLMKVSIVNSLVDITDVNCKFQTKLNPTKYSSAVIKNHIVNENGDIILLFILNCLAGADCQEYYVGILDKEYQFQRFLKVARQYAEGEYNEMVYGYSFRTNDTLQIITGLEKYSEELGDYVEKTDTLNYVIDLKRNITKIK